jgi:tRNA threonylcarbamoyladenosine biosynthesis protein TsaE
MNSSTPITLASLELLQAEAASFASGLTPAKGHATLITLSGELGAGKTSFTQGIAQALGIIESITSPTFVLEKVYELSDQAFSRLVHIDAYRLEGDMSLKPLGFHDLYTDPTNLIVIEWPERVRAQLPDADHSLTLSVVGEGRELIYA